MGLSSSKTKVVEVGGCYWHVGRLLGKGAYSTVKQLSNKELGKELAVKLIDKRLLLSRGTGSITGALAERDILNTYAHPFFVNMVASFESNTHLIIILELRSGGSLGYHLTQRHRFSEDETRWVAASLLLALQHLRTWGVAHRDIKPENMLFDERGYIYLSDFNCARFINRERPQLQGRAGTLDYMAPEMFSGSYNLSCDVWSTGILLYRMIYGRVPWRVIDRQPTFDRRSKSAEHNLSKLSRVDRRRVHMIKHAQIPYPVRPDLPAAVPAFLSRLLERDHSIRATPAELMTDPWLETVDWAAMLRHEPIAPFIPKPGRSNIPAEVLFNDQFATPHKAPPKASKKPLSPEEQDRFAGWKEWTSPAYCQFLADSLATIQSSSSSSSSSSSATSSSSSTASLAAPSCQSSSFATYSFPLSSATSSALSSSPPSTSSFSSSSYCLPSSSSASSLYSLNYSLPSPPSSPPPISLAPSEISKYHRRSLLRGSEGLRERRMTSSASTPANDSMAELAIQKVQSSLSSPSLSEASESEAVIERQVHSDIKMRKSVPSRSRRRRSSREAKLPTSVHPLSLATETSPQGETPPFARTSPQLVEHRSQESGLTASGSPNDVRKIRSAEAILHKGAGENLRGENKRNRPRHPKKSRSPRPQHPENHPV